MIGHGAFSSSASCPVDSCVDERDIAYRAQSFDSDKKHRISDIVRHKWCFCSECEVSGARIIEEFNSSSIF